MVYQILTATTVASDHNEGLSTHYDPYISCWDRPPTHQAGLPASYSQSDYANNLMLCSAAHGVPRANVGCFCTGSSGDVFCSRNIADPVLWSATISLHDHGEEHYDFPEWCKISCECITEGQAEAEHRGDINYYDSDFQSLRDINDVLYSSSQSSSESSSSSSSSSSNGTAESGTNNTEPALTNPSDKSVKDNNNPEITVLHSHCGNPCTSNQDCSSSPSSPHQPPPENTTTTTNCMCSTQSQQYLPGTGTVAFVAACIISLSGSGKGKREEEGEGEGGGGGGGGGMMMSRPCPCNGSYVSYACCGAWDGVVWEGREGWLGVVVGRGEERRVDD